MPSFKSTAGQLILLVTFLVAISALWPSQVWWTTLVVFLGLIGPVVECVVPVFMREKRTSELGYDFLSLCVLAFFQAISQGIVKLVICAVLGFVTGVLVCYLHFGNFWAALVMGPVSTLFSAVSWFVFIDLVPFHQHMRIHRALTNLARKAEAWYHFENRSVYE